jgi:hypothetical protein
MIDADLAGLVELDLGQARQLAGQIGAGDLVALVGPLAATARTLVGGRRRQR